MSKSYPAVPDKPIANGETRKANLRTMSTSSEHNIANQALQVLTPPKNRSVAIVRTIVRLIVLVGVVFAVNMGLNWVLESAKLPDSGMPVTAIIVVSLIVYTLLMAMPFVPGIEIGVSLLLMQGSAVAPYVFAATFLGLAISFTLGRYIRTDFICNALNDLGLKRACGLLQRLQPLSQSERLMLLQNNVPAWLGKNFVRYRYLLIAASLNVPGNFVIGGGGGIALIAGMSRMFSPFWTLLTFAISISPVPIAVYIFGTGFLN